MDRVINRLKQTIENQTFLLHFKWLLYLPTMSHRKCKILLITVQVLHVHFVRNVANEKMHRRLQDRLRMCKQPRLHVHRAYVFTDLYFQSCAYWCKRRYLCPLCRAIDNRCRELWRGIAWRGLVQLVSVYTHINNASAISHVIDGVPPPS